VARAPHEADVGRPALLEGRDPVHLEPAVALDGSPAEAFGQLAEAHARP
jgi:hypothetical protein